MIGEMISKLLLDTGDYTVTLVDISDRQLDKIENREGLTKTKLDVTDSDALAGVLQDHFAVLSAGPYFLTVPVARAALAAGVHYLDLTEDVAGTRQVIEIARQASTSFIPQCGLAPGFIAIAANDIAGHFDELDTVRLRVGALPQFPSNSLNYNLTWSTEGVINEYCEPCIAIVNGKLCEVPPLEHLEEFSLDGIRYESFNTSGGLGTLGDSLQGRVRNLNYQTIRYPGHRNIMKTLLYDLRLAERRELLKDVLENAVPATLQDMVLIYVSVSGRKENKLIQETYANTIYSHKIGDEVYSAIQITTASSICVMLELLRDKLLPQSGFIKQEQVLLSDFLANRFGIYYQQHPAATAAA
jgi:saccharopine dehydrogenase-like NADP-dependent oxidoreductase